MIRPIATTSSGAGTCFKMLFSLIFLFSNRTRIAIEIIPMSAAPGVINPIALNISEKVF